MVGQILALRFVGLPNETASSHCQVSEVLTLGGVKRKAGCFSKFLRGSSGWNKSLENKQVFLALMKNNEIFSYRGFSWCALALGSIEFKPNLRRRVRRKSAPGTYKYSRCWKWLGFPCPSKNDPRLITSLPVLCSSHTSARCCLRSSGDTLMGSTHRT